MVGTFGGPGPARAGAGRIIEEHGGTVTFESREGTTFTVRLPLDGPPAD